MELWGNIVATSSLIIALVAFYWAIRTFGRTRTHLAVDIRVVKPASIAEAFGELGNLLQRVIEDQRPGATATFRSFHRNVWPVLRLGISMLVEGSPILRNTWPSMLTWFSESPVLLVAVRNEGATPASVSAVEVGRRRKWRNVDGRTVYSGLRLTDSLPAPVRVGAHMEVWLPTEEVYKALDALNLAWDEARIRVTSASKKRFFARLRDVPPPVWGVRP